MQVQFTPTTFKLQYHHTSCQLLLWR